MTAFQEFEPSGLVRKVANPGKPQACAMMAGHPENNCPLDERATRKFAYYQLPLAPPPEELPPPKDDRLEPEEEFSEIFGIVRTSLSE